MTYTGLQPDENPAYVGVLEQACIATTTDRLYSSEAYRWMIRGLLQRIETMDKKHRAPLPTKPRLERPKRKPVAPPPATRITRKKGPS